MPKRGGGGRIESKVIEEYTPLVDNFNISGFSKFGEDIIVHDVLLHRFPEFQTPKPFVNREIQQSLCHVRVKP